MEFEVPQSHILRPTLFTHIVQDRVLGVIYLYYTDYPN